MWGVFHVGGDGFILDVNFVNTQVLLGGCITFSKWIITLSDWGII